MARPIGSKSKPIILDAVEKLIATKGVKDVSLHDIALSCGLSQGTLYYHYATKDDIIFDVIVKHIDELQGEYLEWIKRHEHDLTPERFLEVIFYKGVKLFDRAKMHIFLINECMSENETLKKKFLEKYSEWRSALLLGVKNVFAESDDPEALAYLLMLLLDGLVMQEVLQAPSFDESRLIAVVKKMGK